MKSLVILASLLVSFTSQNPVTVKKMVLFQDGAPSSSVVLDEPITISEAPIQYAFDLAKDLKGGYSIALYEADTTKADGIGRACSFVYGRNAKDTDLILKDNGERYDVKARGYYKSLFIDAGYKLSSLYLPSQFAWISTLSLENDYEYVQTPTKDSTKVAIQNGVMVGSPTSLIDWKDDNGVLLYPDGEPRFRLIYSNGGSSSAHGASIGDKGRNQIHTFFENGGSYIGTCAGAFLGCVGSKKGNRFNNPNKKVTNYTYGLYPGSFISTSVPINIKKYPSVYTAMELTDRCKEIGASYGYQFADTIERVRHHGGGYMKPGDEEKFPGVEILMRYAYTQQQLDDTCSYTDQMRLTLAMHGRGSKIGVRKSIAGKVSTIAWKENNLSGRVCITGSHPEKGVVGGNNHNMICMMAQYAMDGNGDAQTKAELTKGKAYVSPVGVGDLQYHHFTFTTDKELKNVKIVLDAKTKADLYLTLRSGDFAWLSDADYMVCSEGGKKTLVVDTLPAGTWYIGVYCATTVQTSVEKKNKIYDYIHYVDPCNVLNGVNYKLTVK